MLQRIREPFGKAGLIVAVVALVAALVGGAYAAGGLTGKQKKEVKKIAKQFAGKEGPQGAAGSSGPQGSKGDKGDPGAEGKAGANGTNGEDGKDGIDGTDGESVTIEELEAGDPECPEGGAEFSNGTGVAYACNGEGGGGSGEFPSTLPSGHTMKGFWLVGDGSDHLFGSSVIVLSFPMELAAAPTETVLLTSNSTEEEKAKCPGGPGNPEPTAGVLCLYVEFEPNPPTLTAGNPVTYGAVLLFPEGIEAFGTWAVKAP